jgi:hypothetical protein
MLWGRVNYLVSATDTSGRINLSRKTPAAALKKARELLSEGCWDVRIYCPDGRVFTADEFDQFET